MVMHNTLTITFDEYGDAYVAWLGFDQGSVMLGAMHTGAMHTAYTERNWQSNKWRILSRGRYVY